MNNESKTFDEIIQIINNFQYDYKSCIELIDEISNFKDKDQQNILCEELLKKIKMELINNYNKLSFETIRSTIHEIRSQYIYKGWDFIFIDNDFNLDDIMEEISNKMTNDLTIDKPISADTSINQESSKIFAKTDLDDELEITDLDIKLENNIETDELDDDFELIDLDDLTITENKNDYTSNMYEYLKSQINNITEENFIEIINNIAEIPDEARKKELYDLFIKNIKLEIIKYEDYKDEEHLKTEIENITNSLITIDPLTESILASNKFDLDSIKQLKNIENNRYIEDNDISSKEIAPQNYLENAEEDRKEIAKIEASIYEKESKYLYTREFIIKRLVIQKEEYENEITTLKSNPNQDIEKIELAENNLSLVEKNLKTQEALGIDLTIEEKDELIESIDKQELLIEIVEKTFDYDIENLKLNIAKSDERLRVLNKQIKFLNNGRDNIEEQTIDYADEDLKPIKDILNLIDEKKNKWSHHELGKEEMEFYHQIDELTLQIDKKIEELEISKQEEMSKNDELKNKYLSKNLEKTEINNLKKEKSIKKTYYQILVDTEKQFNNPEEIDKITEFINNHAQIKELDKYQNNEKLKQELIENAIDKLELKRIIKTEENKKLWLKALANIAGFATGLSASCVPGIGTIRMGLAATKLAGSAINLWAKKHPNGIISSIKNGINAKIDKYPKIVAGIYQMKEKLNSYPINSFINGVAAGYTVGNIIEMLTGDTLFNHLEKGFAPETEYVQIEPEIDVDVPETQIERPLSKPHIEMNLPEENIDVLPDKIIPDKIIPNQGEVFDLSSLTKGYRSPDAISSIDVIESLGKEVVFDKAVQLPNGKIMWHFRQLTGEGYAWFDAEVVQELLSKTEEITSKTL